MACGLIEIIMKSSHFLRRFLYVKNTADRIIVGCNFYGSGLSSESPKRCVDLRYKLQQLAVVVTNGIQQLQLE